MGGSWRIVIFNGRLFYGNVGRSERLDFQVTLRNGKWNVFGHMDGKCVGRARFINLIWNDFGMIKMVNANV